MITKILQPPTMEEFTQPVVTSLQEVAETIQIDALQHAHTRFTQPMRAADLAEVLQRNDFIDHFKFGLAERIANTLAAHDEHVQAIYYFDPNLNSDAEIETGRPGNRNRYEIGWAHAANNAVMEFLYQGIRPLPLYGYGNNAVLG